MYISEDILIFVQVIVVGSSVLGVGFYITGCTWKYSEFVYLEYNDEYSRNHTLLGLYSVVRFKFKYKEVKSKYCYYVFKGIMSLLLTSAFSFLFVISIKTLMI